MIIVIRFHEKKMFYIMNQILISRIFFTDMYKIIGDIEGDASFQGGRRSISPIPRGRSSVYDNPLEREPIRAKRYLIIIILFISFG